MHEMQEGCIGEMGVKVGRGRVLLSGVLKDQKIVTNMCLNEKLKSLNRWSLLELSCILHKMTFVLRKELYKF